MALYISGETTGFKRGIAEKVFRLSSVSGQKANPE